MIIVTSPQIVGKKITKTLGMVRGTTVRAHHVGNDIIAYMRNLVGGEVIEYTKMLAEAREQAAARNLNWFPDCLLLQAVRSVCASHEFLRAPSASAAPPN